MTSKYLLLLTTIFLLLISCKPAEKTKKAGSEVTTDKVYGQQRELDPQIEIPEIKGGLKAVQRNLKYPERARENNIQGRVMVSFIVNKKGKAENFEIIEGLGYDCTEAAINAIKKSSFEPARKNGVPVNFQFALPITFSLD